MGALETRAVSQAGGDDSWCPWSETYLPPAVLAAYWTLGWTGEQTWRLLHRTPPGGPPELIAEGFERVEPVTAEVAGDRSSWQERRVVYLHRAGNSRSLQTRYNAPISPPCEGATDDLRPSFLRTTAGGTAVAVPDASSYVYVAIRARHPWLDTSPTSVATPSAFAGAQTVCRTDPQAPLCCV
jgi:hypothetical protein